jgi:hypothetical protein
MLSSFFVSAREIDCNLDNPIASWQFNEGNGTNAQETCYGYNTTFYGSLEWSNSTPYGNALKFNGIDSYVDAGNFFNQNMQEFSFSLWTNMSYKIAYQSLFQSGNYYTGEYLEALQVNEGDNDYVVFMSDNSIGYPPIDDGVWHNVIGTFNGSDNGNVSLYIDGVPIASVLTYQAQIDATTNPLYFGINYTNGFLLDGFLDEIAFFNRTLTPQEAMNINNTFNQGINMSLILYVQHYPYVDFNVSYPIQVKLFKNDTELSDAIVYMEIRNSTGFVTPLYLYYNPISEFYENTVIFNKVGNYPFFIEANSFSSGYINTTGTFLVRKPYYVDVKLFDAETLANIENDFGYVLAEPINPSKTNSVLESYFYPITWNKGSAFHAPYISGDAQLKLWDKQTYAMRFITGDIAFSGTFSPPNITRSYGINTYLGNYAGNGTNVTLQYVVSEKELHQYRYLANWLLIIGLVLVLFVAGVLFFMFPEFPLMSFIFGILFIIILLGIRVAVWFWKGF